MATSSSLSAPAFSPPRFRARIAAARARTDELFQWVDPAAIYDRPIPERHRIIFYLGHLEAFDWNLIGGHALGRPPLDPALDRLFAFGIDPVGADLPADAATDWPAIAEVRRYVVRARAALDELLGSSALDSAAGRLLNPATILNVAIEHRLMHAETLTYMLHQLPPERKAAGPVPAPTSGPAPDSRMIEVPAGIATLGMARASQEFGWDNEFEAHSVRVPAFAIDATKVTVGEYLAFVRAGGYAEPAHWTPEDWAWIRARGIEHPLFWRAKDGEWWIRTQFGAIPLPLAWPVYVSHAEASAYARWAGKRLPSEAEWHRAAFGTPAGERLYPWGNDPPAPEHGHFDFQGWDPVPVDSHPAGRSAFGALGMLGNGWEWTRSPFEPFPGFEPFPFYLGYSADFFDHRHFVVKGASPRTAACMLRRSFRNWYQGHYGYVYAGFRCVAD